MADYFYPERGANDRKADIDLMRAHRCHRRAGFEFRTDPRPNATKYEDGFVAMVPIRDNWEDVVVSTPAIDHTRRIREGIIAVAMSYFGDDSRLTAEKIAHYRHEKGEWTLLKVEPIADV